MALGMPENGASDQQNGASNQQNGASDQQNGAKVERTALESREWR